MGAVAGSTRVAGVIGSPVAHSRSPAIHNAGYAALGLDWVFVPFEVPPGAAPAALDAMRVLGLGGLSVTMPHKTDAAAACDRLTETAAALGAVNTITRRGDELVGDSTDGEGLLRSLRDEGVDVTGKSVVVLGAGGAARAITRALGHAGAQVTVAARRVDAAQAAAALAPGAAAIDLSAARQAVAAAAVVVNATPLGMQGESPPFDPDALGGQDLVLDAVYHPAETPLLAAVRARGVRGANGLGMLVHQAALAFEQFTGIAPPLDALQAAAAR